MSKLPRQHIDLLLTFEPALYPSDTSMETDKTAEIHPYRR